MDSVIAPVGSVAGGVKVVFQRYNSSLIFSLINNMVRVSLLLADFILPIGQGSDLQGVQVICGQFVVLQCEVLLSHVSSTQLSSSQHFYKSLFTTNISASNQHPGPETH